MDHLENWKAEGPESRGIGGPSRVSKALEEFVHILVGRQIGRSYML